MRGLPLAFVAAALALSAPARAAPLLANTDALAYTGGSEGRFATAGSSAGYARLLSKRLAEKTTRRKRPTRHVKTYTPPVTGPIVPDAELETKSLPAQIAYWKQRIEALGADYEPAAHEYAKLTEVEEKMKQAPMDRDLGPVQRARSQATKSAPDGYAPQDPAKTLQSLDKQIADVKAEIDQRASDREASRDEDAQLAALEEQKIAFSEAEVTRQGRGPTQPGVLVGDEMVSDASRLLSSGTGEATAPAGKGRITGWMESLGKFVRGSSWWPKY